MFVSYLFAAVCSVAGGDLTLSGCLLSGSGIVPSTDERKLPRKGRSARAKEEYAQQTGSPFVEKQRYRAASEHEQARNDQQDPEYRPANGSGVRCHC
jgi:hypothetical protein